MHGLIGPNGSGKTTTLNVISGYYAASTGGTMRARRRTHCRPGCRQCARARGIARTFQTPRMIGEASVLENVMIGGTIEGQATFVEALLALPRTGATSAGSRPRRARCSASSDWKRWPTSAPTGCSTASCASSRSPAR